MTTSTETLFPIRLHSQVPGAAVGVGGQDLVTSLRGHSPAHPPPTTHCLGKARGHRPEGESHPFGLCKEGSRPQAAMVGRSLRDVPRTGTLEGKAPKHSRRPRRQDPDSPGAQQPGWDLIPIPAKLWSICKGGYGPHLCLERPPGCSGEREVREAPDRAGDRALQIGDGRLVQ